MPKRGRQDPNEPYLRITLDEAKAMLDEGNALVVDVRNDDEWVSGHVKDAVHIPVDAVLSRLDELPQEKELLFICARGVRSGLACEMAAAMGLDPHRLYNIEDGTQAWIDKSLPTAYGT